MKGNIITYFEQKKADRKKGMELYAKDRLNEYRSRLKEVLKETGQLTELDLDYCYELILQTKQPPANQPRGQQYGNS